jgi:rubredoxin
MKVYNWECPYCNLDAKGFESYLTKYPYDHSCPVCGKRYKVGLDKGKLYVTAKMETLLRYLCGLALQKYERLSNVPDGLGIGHKTFTSEKKFKAYWCSEEVKRKLADRYGYIGSFNSLLALDNL